MTTYRFWVSMAGVAVGALALAMCVLLTVFVDVRYGLLCVALACAGVAYAVRLSYQVGRRKAPPPRLPGPGFWATAHGLAMWPHTPTTLAGQPAVIRREQPTAVLPAVPEVQR